MRIKKFHNLIFDWWRTYRRDLPWRHTHDPYKILVSEVMLQQTQVSRVLPKYKEFIKKFPTAEVLSKAPISDVLRMWKGMGYNRRALYLRKAAELVVNNYYGNFPKSEKELVKLPGLGMYTARAILVFAYKQNIAMVDTNIRQIITHFFFNGKPQKEAAIQEVADSLVPKGKSWEWHQALMDYGALALPKLRTKNSELNGQQKKKIPFRQSNRFYRGRIIDILREKPVKERVLLKSFSPTTIDDLLKDGLIERRDGTLSLPGEEE